MLPTRFPVPAPLALDPVARLAHLDAARPLRLLLVLHRAPLDAVLRHRAQALQAQVLEREEALVEVVRQTVGFAAVAQDRRVVVVQAHGHAAREQRGERVREDARGQPEHFVRDRARFDQDLFLADHGDQQRVFVEREAVADAACAEQDRVEEVVVGQIAVAEAFAGVEEEGDFEGLLGAGLAEPEEEWDEGDQRSAFVFLRDEVEAGDYAGVRAFGRDAVLHVGDEGLVGHGADRRPEDPGVPELGVAGFEEGEFLREALEHVDVVGVRGWGVCAVEGGEEREAEFDVGYAVGVELAEEARDATAEDGFGVEEGVDDHEAGLEFSPYSVETVVVMERFLRRDGHPGYGPGFEGGVSRFGAGGKGGGRGGYGNQGIGRVGGGPD